MSQTMTAPTLGSRLGTWLTYALTLLMVFIVGIEIINILFYDPWGEEVFLFLFRSAGCWPGWTSRPSPGSCSAACSCC